jgi:hypothetical protein
MTTLSSAGRLIFADVGVQQQALRCGSRRSFVPRRGGRSTEGERVQSGVITLYSEYYTQAFCLTTALTTAAGRGC